MKKLINQHDLEGRRHGVWESYRSDGALMWRAHYHHGKMHGVCEWYYSDGTLGRKVHYNMDRLVGREQEWDEKGELVKSVDHGGQVPTTEVEADLVLLMSDPAEMFAPIKQDF